MKKIMILCLMIGVIITTGCGKSVKEKITGSWKLKSIEGETLSKEDLANASITFDADGKLSATSGTDRKMDGTWELGKDEKSLTITFKDGASKEVWNILSLTDIELVYTSGDAKEKITLGK